MMGQPVWRSSPTKLEVRISNDQGDAQWNTQRWPNLSFDDPLGHKWFMCSLQIGLKD